ncbi:hypothetical protein IscW_ISCW001240 [Ixodes scapularis]|uniref:Uncharacterized protein n=1 Tax=Ixodes scapularis TaxID=6945 RepID=B7P6K0_IXOSC|nr:hypothetical protein IscW_ISCW001240 [Ixodes scapularis]|eukprot:XP_002408993.1 hypothetical protein IscW_ISCW001240 [Ixodes scapularis]
MVEKLIEEKITDAQLAAIVKSKLPEVQVCLMTMAAMTPEITVKVSKCPPSVSMQNTMALLELSTMDRSSYRVTQPYSRRSDCFSDSKLLGR